MSFLKRVVSGFAVLALMATGVTLSNTTSATAAEATGDFASDIESAEMSGENIAPTASEEDPWVLENGVLTINTDSLIGVPLWNATQRDMVTKVIFTRVTKLPASTNQMFAMENLVAIEGSELMDTSNVKDMIGMFNGATSLESLDVSGWDTSNVNDMWGMFSPATSLKSLDLSGWDTRNVKDMIGMFNGATSLESLNLSGWDTTNVTTMSHIFNNIPSLRELTLGAGFKFGTDHRLSDLPDNQSWLASDSKRYSTADFVALTGQTGWSGGTFIVVTDRVVYFDGQGSEGIEPIESYETAVITLPKSELVRPGYEFVGWNTSPDGIGTLYAPGDTYEIPYIEGFRSSDTDITFFAQWIEADDSGDGDGGGDGGTGNGGSGDNGSDSGAGNGGSGDGGSDSGAGNGGSGDGGAADVASNGGSSNGGGSNGGSTLAATGASSLGIIGGLAVVLTAAGVFLVRSNRKNLNRI